MRKFAFLSVLFCFVTLQSALAQPRDLFAEFEAENAADTAKAVEAPAAVPADSAAKPAESPAASADSAVKHIPAHADLCDLHALHYPCGRSRGFILSCLQSGELFPKLGDIKVVKCVKILQKQCKCGFCDEIHAIPLFISFRAEHGFFIKHYITEKQKCQHT